MGQGGDSFATQLAHLTGNRFSYCMVNVHNLHSSYLKFGSDVVIARNAQSTPFVKKPAIRFTNDHYYLELLDIGINGQRMHIPGEYFHLHADGRGGCLIDSGTPYSFLITPAYRILKHALTVYFQTLGVMPATGAEAGFDVCFRPSSGFDLYPTLELHFRGATLRLEKSSVFLTLAESGIFCLTMMGNDERTIIGAAQQENHQFVYDVGRGRLYFAPADCAAG